MKAGLLKKVAQEYAAFFEPPWRRVRNEFMRRSGDWIQIVAFNPSRWDDVYEPRSCFEFLKMPGPSTGGWLLHALKHPNGTQRWVRASRLCDTASNDSAGKVFGQMVLQFAPSVAAPLLLPDIKRMLNISLDYWPHAYALCVMAAEAGDAPEATRYFAVFLEALGDAPYAWAEERKIELDACLREIGTEALRSRLAAIAAEKLRQMKFT